MYVVIEGGGGKKTAKIEVLFIQLCSVWRADIVICMNHCICMVHENISRVLLFFKMLF